MKAVTSYYSFRAYGRTSEGIRVDCSGHVSGEAPNRNGFPPQSVLDRARQLVLEQFPTFKFPIERHPGMTGYPTLRYLKKKPKWAKSSEPAVDVTDRTRPRQPDPVLQK